MAIYGLYGCLFQIKQKCRSTKKTVSNDTRGFEILNHLLYFCGGCCAVFVEVVVPGVTCGIGALGRKNTQK
jgi:hypothetical protein